MMEIVTGLRNSPAANPTRKAPKDFVEKAKVLNKNREYSLALALLRQACNLDPYNLRALRMLTETLDLAGKTSESLRVKQAIKSLYSDFQSFFAYAQALYQSGQEDEEALKAYFECLSVLEEPTSDLFEVYKNMGNISVKLRDYDGAEEFYNKAFVINPDSDILMVNRGTLEVQRGDFEKAIFFFREALRVNPQNDKAWVGLALMHSEYGDHELAWGNLNTAIDLEKYNRTAILLFSKWSIRDRKEPAAIMHLENYLSVHPFDEELTALLINFYCRMNRFDLAKIEALKIVAWDPSNTNMKNIIGQLQKVSEENGN